MARPRCCRRVASAPSTVFFKPAGIPLRQLEEVQLTLDEFESLRLADFEGFYHDAAAQRMGISRPTFSRLLAEARRKVTAFLVRGTALRIEGGTAILNRPEIQAEAARDRTGARGRRKRCRWAAPNSSSEHVEAGKAESVKKTESDK